MHGVVSYIPDDVEADIGTPSCISSSSTEGFASITEPDTTNICYYTCCMHDYTQLLTFSFDDNPDKQYYY